MEAERFRAVAAHHATAASEAAEKMVKKDAKQRAALRKLGLWRLVGRLGLEASVSERSK